MLLDLKDTRKKTACEMLNLANEYFKPKFGSRFLAKGTFYIKPRVWKWSSFPTEFWSLKSQTELVQCFILAVQHLTSEETGRCGGILRNGLHYMALPHIPTNPPCALYSLFTLLSGFCSWSLLEDNMLLYWLAGESNGENIKDWSGTGDRLHSSLGEKSETALQV